MFDRLSSSLQKIFSRLRGHGRLTERNVQDALREVRLALLEADVNFEVVRDFTARVKEKSLGKDVLESISPGQQMIKHVHDEMAALLGGARRDFDWSVRPSHVLLLGLHGAGKTTTASKLAARWKAEGRRILLAAGDLRRPAAVDQLRILAEAAGVEAVTPRPGEDLGGLARRVQQQAARDKADAVIFDTGGRFQLDSELVQELKDLRDLLQPRNVVLVLDAAIGQESVHVAQTFQKEVGLTGLILTKLDGDARGGAALSVQAVTGCPILLVGTGERPADLEPFHPDRMASRILGMGDVVTLVEKAQQAFDEQEMERMQESLVEGSFDLGDFLGQLQQVKKMGPLENLLEMMPGMGALPAGAKGRMEGFSDRDLKRTEAIIRSMTPEERRNPALMNASRKRRVAAGSGTQVHEINDLLRNFERAKDMSRRMKQMQKRLLRRPK
ncbi:MAG: Signal recognition particle protein [Verrucomicrobia bacterium ADurb.Bin345]|nr:MAG: Signal recognition particle protein [Verrucomicrobia bacterium ADurb.Bin345]